MIKDDKKNIELMEEFHKLAIKNNIWYSIDSKMLYGSLVHSGFVPWHKKNQIMMTIESFNKLKREFPNRIADSSNNKNIKNLCAYFVKDKNNVIDPQPFIEIRVLIPTTLKKIKKFKLPCNILWNKIKRRKLNLKTVINDLNDRKFQGFWLPTKVTDKIQPSWIQTISFKTKEIEFAGIKVSAIIEDKKIVDSWFEPQYEEWHKVPSKTYEYISPILINRVEK